MQREFGTETYKRKLLVPFVPPPMLLFYIHRGVAFEKFFLYFFLIFSPPPFHAPVKNIIYAYIYFLTYLPVLLDKNPLIVMKE